MDRWKFKKKSLIASINNFNCHFTLTKMFCCNLKNLIFCFEIKIHVFQGQFISKTIYCCSQHKHYVNFGI